MLCYHTYSRPLKRSLQWTLIPIISCCPRDEWNIRTSYYIVILYYLREQSVLVVRRLGCCSCGHWCTTSRSICRGLDPPRPGFDQTATFPAQLHLPTCETKRFQNSLMLRVMHVQFLVTGIQAREKVVTHPNSHIFKETVRQELSLFVCEHTYAICSTSRYRWAIVMGKR